MDTQKVLGGEEGTMSWAQREMAYLEGCEKRLRRRLVSLLEDCGSKPGASLPRACGNWARSKGAYRCLSNPAVTSQELIGSHTEATWARMRAHAVVLAVADTTSLNHTSHPATKGLGPLNKEGSSARGLHLHSVLAFSEQGEPLGVLHAYTWARSQVRGRAKNKRDINRRAPQSKESHRWVEGYEALVKQSEQHLGSGEDGEPMKSPQLIMVADREGDMYELFLSAQAHKEHCGLLVRALHPRRLEQDGTVLWDHLQKQTEAGCIRLEVPAQGSRPARIATLSVRSAAVSLGVPRDKKQYFGASEPLALWAIEAVENHAPAGETPLHWKLLTTEDAGSFVEASRQLGWYAKRWGIEVFHKTLKSGCRTEDRQLGTMEGLVRMLMVDAVVAWRIMAITHAARLQPEAAASGWLSEGEWKVLSCWATKRPPPSKAPSIAQAVTWIARLGGFLARKSDGPPGVQSLWIGLQRLQPMTELWNAQLTCG
jgi:hypothetical protein